MGKIRIKTLGDETQEKAQQKDAQKRREAKAFKKEHTKGVGLKGGQKISSIEGDEIKPEIAALLNQEAGADEPKKKTKKAKVKVRSHRYKELTEKIDKDKLYPLKEAIKLTQELATTKFDASVDIHININPLTLEKDKQSMSGVINLPHGTGKKRRIVVASEELIEDIQKGKIEFDVLVSHPSLMSKLARVAKVLGPKGLMPNPKNGTVTPDPEKRVKELEGGEFTWKTEPDHPIIHQAVGKVSFKVDQLEENIVALVKAIGLSKVARVTISSSMGPGVRLEVSSVS